MYGGVLVARKIAGGIYTLHNVDKLTIPSHHLPPQPASSLVHSNQTVSMVICTTAQWGLVEHAREFLDSLTKGGLEESG